MTRVRFAKPFPDTVRAETRKEISKVPKAATDYCVKCLTVLQERKDVKYCPKCTGNQQTARRFCRKCLYVHGPETCKTWTPKG